LPIAWIAIILGVNALLARFSRFANELAERGLEAKEPVPATGMPHEITPLISAMNELIARHKAAAEQQKQFLSDAAHELRTPLAALQIQIDNFRNQPSAEAKDAALRELKAGIQRATAMIRQLMRMARLDDGALGSGSQTLDLKDVLITIVSDFVRMASARNIDLEMEIDESASTAIPDTEIRFLFTNLIDNAVRYSIAGGRVTVILRRTGSDIFVEVKDCGIGIPVAALPRLYDRFYRAAPADIEGTGLGLAIARKIADRNGFGLEISNNIDGPGVSAVVFIPQAT
jgi:two-component system OmpR family sensor kinase